jgi:citrate/tricarballylate utilization protein
VHATDALSEARRLMTVCNSCRYCEGLCAVFPAMEMRRTFPDHDLNYLANLCHGCGACYIDCQFAPPHEFNVNVPKVLAQVRAESYAVYAWPEVARGLFHRNGVVLALITAASVAIFTIAFFFAAGPPAFFSPNPGSGAFYRIMPHNTMALLFGSVFALACAALAMAQRNFNRGSGSGPAELGGGRPLLEAAEDAARLRYLDGGGAGCYSAEGRQDNRRFFHHLTFYGFLLCFASTSVATLYHYGLHREAPYPWYDLPVVLGFFGGLGLLAGPVGLLREKRHRDPALSDDASQGMDAAFLAMLLLTSATGLGLLFLRATPMMSLLLAIHLGAVFALFVTLPYGKFVHGLYRFAALLRYAKEKRAFLQKR